MRRCFEVLGECRDLGADASLWQPRLLQGLCGLLGAQVGIAGTMRHFGESREPEGIGSLRLGWETPEHERAWLEYVDSVPVQRTPEYPLLSRAVESMVTRARDQLWDRGVWYRSRAFNEFHRAAGVDDYIISIRRQTRAGVQHSLWVHRAVGDRPFTRREWWLLRYVHEQVGAMVGGALAAVGEPSVSDLTRRQRQVLDGLLDGDSEKQIAYVLGVSPATVHEHVMAVYRRFGVSSRGELLAWFVGRSRPPRGR